MKNDVISKCILEYKRKFTDPRITCIVGKFLGGVCSLWLTKDICIHLHLDGNYEVRKAHMNHKEDEAWFSPRTCND